MRKPLLGTILGIIIGVAVAIVVQQQGIWPLDRLTVFLLPALTGLGGMLLLTLGREGSVVTLVISLIILVPMAVWGALGLADIDEKGVLNGGCMVTAQAAADSTTVSDTSKQNPFEIDPDGGLTWAASSPTVWMDYDWRIWVEVGSNEVTLDSDIEPNEGGSQVNGDTVPNVTAYAEARGVPIDQLRGVFKVGGDANSNTCNGFAFVKIVSDPFESLISKIAAGVALLVLIILIVIAIRGGEVVVEEVSRTVIGPGDDVPPA